MKKLFLLPLIASFAVSCSTDDISTDLQESAFNGADKRAAGLILKGEDMPSGQTKPCSFDVTAEVLVNLPNGLGGVPDLIFKAYAPNADPQEFQVYLVIENLVDCEDLNAGTGEFTAHFLGSLANVNTNNPTKTLKPWDVPQDCYRWRFVIERRSTKIFQGCSSYSPWYDAPLY